MVANDERLLQLIFYASKFITKNRKQNVFHDMRPLSSKRLKALVH